MTEPRFPTMPAIPHTGRSPFLPAPCLLLGREAFSLARQWAVRSLADPQARNFQTSETLARRCASTGTTESTNQTCQESATCDPGDGPSGSYTPVHRSLGGPPAGFSSAPDECHRAALHPSTICATTSATFASSP